MLVAHNYLANIRVVSSFQSGTTIIFIPFIHDARHDAAVGNLWESSDKKIEVAIPAIDWEQSDTSRPTARHSPSPDPHDLEKK